MQHEHLNNPHGTGTKAQIVSAFLLLDVHTNTVLLLNVSLFKCIVMRINHHCHRKLGLCACMLLRIIA